MAKYEIVFNSDLTKEKMINIFFLKGLSILFLQIAYGKNL